MPTSTSIVLAACTYELDVDYRLIAVDEAWSAFAAANGAPELVAPAPLGRTIWSSISDVTTVHLYQQILDRVAATGEAVCVPIRCDAPDLCRYLDLQITRRRPSGFVIRSVVSRVEP